MVAEVEDKELMILEEVDVNKDWNAKTLTFSDEVNEELVSYAKSDFLFMHDMPAHRGEEISQHMLDHPNSVVYEQAENRLHAQKTIIAELFGH